MWPLHHLQQHGSCHCHCVWGGYVVKQFLKGEHHLLLQNVKVHVGFHVSLNELQLPSTSNSHAAPDHDATTTMLDCRQGTICFVLLTRASPHMLDTIWVKPQDMVPVIHALGQVVFSKLFAGFFVSQLQKRLPSGTMAMQTDLLQCAPYGLRGHRPRRKPLLKLTHKKADLLLLRPLKQCWQRTHASVFWSQLLHLTHSTRTQLLWSTLARPVLS